MPSRAGEALGDLARVLNALEVEWFMFGAQAAIVHGVARATFDIDVTVALPPALDVTSLAAHLARAGFDLRFTDPAFLAQTRVLACVHQRTGQPVDLVVGGSGFDAQCLMRAEIRVIEGTPVPVATAEDIIILKILAGRDKDNRDVETIVAVNPGNLDRAYIERTLQALEQALDQSDLILTLDTLWKKATRLRLE